LNIDGSNLLSTFLVALLGAGAGALATVSFAPMKLFEHSLGKALENHRSQIQKRIDRVLKIQNREFEMLPEIWFGIVNTDTLIYKVMKVVQTQPDAEAMSDLEAAEFALANGISESRMKRVRDSSDKNATMTRIIFETKLRDAGMALSELDKAYNSARILLGPDLDNELSKLTSLFIECMTILSVAIYGQERIHYDSVNQAAEVHKEANPHIDRIRELIKDRLGFEQV
jgi:hypothetical protein